jgi:hypothetical protein
MMGVGGRGTCTGYQGYHYWRHCGDQRDRQQSYDFCFHSFSYLPYALRKYKSRFLKAVQEVVVRRPSTSALVRR